jgi:hypothetical protein
MRKLRGSTSESLEVHVTSSVDRKFRENNITISSTAINSITFLVYLQIHISFLVFSIIRRLTKKTSTIRHAPGSGTVRLGVGLCQARHYNLTLTVKLKCHV